jgi:hypothetical protein
LHLGQGHLARREPGCKSMHDSGSGKHWDYECCYSKREVKTARTRNVTSLDDEEEALQEYDALYDELESESEEEHNSTAYKIEANIATEEPTETTAAHTNCAKVLVDNNDHVSKKDSTVHNYSVNKAQNLNELKARNYYLYKQIKRKERRERKSYTRRAYEIIKEPFGVLRLSKSMARPSGCTFLGAKATSTKVWLGEYGTNGQSLIADSGSDITLISQDALREMEKPSKIRTGQKVNLIQVTGSSKISGYVNLPIYFNTDQGPVLIEVEAYVVKGMTTPLILGNDFADQYSISLIQENNNSYLMFGVSGQKAITESALDLPLRDFNGHALKIRALPNLISLCSRFKVHWKMKKSRKRERMRIKNSEVRASEQIVIPPESCSTVGITAYFPGNSNEVYVERLLHINDKYSVYYGITDSLINRTTTKIKICNFSQRPVLVQRGQLLDYARNPHSYLDKSI